jgi:hypothetical protein
MTDTSIIFTKDRPLTIGTDDFGSYGTIFAPDSDHEIPNPDESTTQGFASQSDYSATFGANGISAPKINLTDWTGVQRG